MLSDSFGGGIALGPKALSMAKFAALDWLNVNGIPAKGTHAKGNPAKGISLKPIKICLPCFGSLERDRVQIMRN